MKRLHSKTLIWSFKFKKCRTIIKYPCLVVNQSYNPLVFIFKFLNYLLLNRWRNNESYQEQIIVNLKSNYFGRFDIFTWCCLQKKREQSLKNLSTFVVKSVRSNYLTNEIISRLFNNHMVMFIRRKRNLDPAPIPLLCLYQGCLSWPIFLIQPKGFLPTLKNKVKIGCVTSWIPANFFASTQK